MSLIRSTGTGAEGRKTLPRLRAFLSRFRLRRGARRPGLSAVFQHFPRMLPFLRPHWKLVVAVMSLIGCSVLIGLAGPWPFALLIDSVLGDKPLPPVLEPILGGLGQYELIAVFVLSGLGLAVLGYGLNIINNYVTTKLNLSLVLDFRRALYKHTQGLSLGFHERIPTGQIVFRLVQQSPSIGQIVVSLPPLIQAVITAIAMLVIAAFLDWQLALLAVVVVPVLIHATRVYARWVQPRIYEVRELEADSQSTLLEGLQMMRVIMSFGRERHEYGRWNERAEKAVGARLKLTIRQTVYSLVIGTTTAAGTALIIGFGAVSVLQNNLTLGELIVLLGYIASIYNPLTQVSTTFAQLQQQFINLESSLSILDTAAEVIEAPDAVTTERAQGRVAYRNISFTYPQIKYKVEEKRSFRPPGEQAEEPASVIPETAPRRVREVLEAPGMVTLYENARALGLGVEELLAATREPALTDVSFEVLTGQHVAVVGPTGAGKTTLLNLLMRFYDPTEGAVLLDGVDLRKLKIASLRDQISVVPQEPLLFGGTIADNIRYGRLGASDEEVEQAAKAANVHEFISRLPGDYETVIGERGSQLSGGERQRISVARAFLKDSPIAILDEPTSSVDSQTEAVILAALDRLMMGRTTFTIAHRLSTVRRADLILVLDEGSLVQRGTHQELLAEGGLYKRLHDIQAGLAEADLSWDGRRRDYGRSPTVLLYADLLVAAIHSLLRDGSCDGLLALVDAYPDRVTAGPTWSLIGAVLAALLDDSEAPLRDLARRAGDPSRIVQSFAVAARHLLDSRDALRAISEDLRRSGSVNGADPMDADLIVREPWTQLAKVSPEAADLLKARLPTDGEGRAARSRSRAAFARGTGA